MLGYLGAIAKSAVRNRGHPLDIRVVAANEGVHQPTGSGGLSPERG